MILKFSIIFILFYLQKSFAAVSDDELQAQFIVNDVSEDMKLRMFKTNTASWNHASNLTDENERINAKVQADFATFSKGVANDLSVFDYKNFQNKTLKRLIKFLTNIGDAKLSENDFNDIQEAVTNMQSTYAKVKVPDFKDRTKLVSLEPEITEAFAKSRNPEELKYYWTKWYNAAGLPSKNNYFNYVKLRNKAAKLNGNLTLIIFLKRNDVSYMFCIGFENGADSWLDEYEDPTFEKQIEDIVEQVKPLYLQLHG
jgi:peptidyl-dipeptidase A